MHTFVIKLCLLAGPILLFCPPLVKGQYDDVRCKCVCPSVVPSNNTGGKPATRKIFVKSFHEPSRCKCENVVDQALLQEYRFCDRCDCQWQRRNTTTIKVVVLFIICVVSLLFMYMLFLLCLDPLMTHRANAYTEQRNEEINMNTQAVEPDPSTQRLDMNEGPGGVISRVRHQVRNVRGEQQKWKGTVQEQRRHIYDRHTMLN